MIAIKSFIAADRKDEPFDRENRTQRGFDKGMIYGF